MAPARATYAPCDSSRTVRSPVLADHLETLLASLAADPEATGLPAYGAAGRGHGRPGALTRWQRKNAL